MSSPVIRGSYTLASPQTVSLSNGSNQFLIPANVAIGNITINNSNTTAVSVVVWALFIEVA